MACLRACGCLAKGACSPGQERKVFTPSPSPSWVHWLCSGDGEGQGLPLEAFFPHSGGKLFCESDAVGCRRTGSWWEQTSAQAHSRAWPLVGDNGAHWDPGRQLHLQRKVWVRYQRSDIMLMTL